MSQSPYNELIRKIKSTIKEEEESKNTPIDKSSLKPYNPAATKIERILLNPKLTLLPFDFLNDFKQYGMEHPKLIKKYFYMNKGQFLRMEPEVCEKFLNKVFEEVERGLERLHEDSTFYHKYFDKIFVSSYHNNKVTNPEEQKQFIPREIEDTIKKEILICLKLTLQWYYSDEEDTQTYTRLVKRFMKLFEYQKYLFFSNEYPSITFLSSARLSINLKDTDLNNKVRKGLFELYQENSFTFIQDTIYGDLTFAYKYLYLLTDVQKEQLKDRLLRKFELQYQNLLKTRKKYYIDLSLIGMLQEIEEVLEW
jgi:hypothetical protein